MEGLEGVGATNLAGASVPEGAAAHEVSDSAPLSSSMAEDLSVPQPSNILVSLSVDQDVLGTFLAMMAVPKHLLIKSSPSLSPSLPLEVMVPGIKVPHLVLPPLVSSSPTPPPQSPPLPPMTPAPPTNPRVSWLPPTASHAMRCPLTKQLASLPGPRPGPRLPLGDRLTEPPVPLAQCLSNPPLATHIGNPLLQDQMGPLPPSGSASRKQTHSELDDGLPPPEMPAPKKKKTRGLQSGKGKQTKRRAKARRAAWEAEEVQEEDAEPEDSQAVAASNNSQLVASGSNMRLEDLEDGKVEDSGFWEDRYKQE